MTLHSHSPAILLALFQKLFAGIPGFLKNDDEPVPGRICFIRDYPEKSIRIVVTTPIKKHPSGALENIGKRLRISFAIYHHDNKNFLQFRDSIITSSSKWIHITSKKTKTLVELVDEIKMCSGSECTELYPFPFVGTASQGKPESTRSVWCECLNCRAKQETAYGTGLKSAISRYLPR